MQPHIRYAPTTSQTKRLSAPAQVPHGKPSARKACTTSSPVWASQPSPGRKISWPVAPAAVSAPNTSPRRRTNQRLATVAASTEAIVPAPRPTTTPQSRKSCQGEVMKTVSKDPPEIRTRAPTTTRRRPKRSISAAAKGPVRPKRTRLIETATEISARLQPNSLSRGTIRTPGVERKPADARSTRKVTPATIQA